MADVLQFKLNGRDVSVRGCSPNTTLLEYLRAGGLTGSKEGCAEGDCGACSVAIVDRDSSGKVCYRAINSCLVPVCLLAGREVISVEGVAAESKVQSPKSKVSANGDRGCECSNLHPVQRQMAERHGSQCGYCTPGFIISLFEGFYRHDIRTEDQLDDQLCGNLCRCTGYRPIRDAAIAAFAERHEKNGHDSYAERLRLPLAELSSVTYESEAELFVRPASLLELLEVLRERPEARLIAGATELGLDITKRYKKFQMLISVEAVPELREINSTDDEWHIGAAATLTEIEEKMASEFPALGRMLRVFGSRQIRNRATMGGNIVTASPIGDSAPVLLALGASLVMVSLKQDCLVERTISINDFFLSYRKTALQPAEILRTIIVPRFAETGITRKCEWYKVSKRREMDISTVAACLAVDFSPDGHVYDARLAYGGVAATPVRARRTEESLRGKPWTAETVDSVLPLLRHEFTPISDVRGMADYRRELVATLFEKFFWDTQRSNKAREEKSPKLPVRAPESTDSPPHESGHKHVTGEAIYVDDLPAGRKMLEVWPVCSPHARARIVRRDVTAAQTMSGIRAILVADDVPGLNDAGTKGDEALLPNNEISFHGQVVALVVGDSVEACRAAAEKVVVEYKPLPGIFTLKQAIAAGSFHNQPNFIRRGDVETALAKAPRSIEGAFELQGQEHFYLETQAAWAEPGEDGSMFVSSSTQHPSEVQAVVAHVLNQPINKVIVQSPRMGGGFGGKETQAAFPAALAALAARHTGRPVRVRFNRDQDMVLTGHRHPFLAQFNVGYDDQGRILAARIHLTSNGGWAQDLSQAVTDRALFHLDNAYYLPAVEFRGQVAKTNLSSNTAFRGFGGPQGMLVIEEILDRIARRLRLLPELVRERNLYHGNGATNTTHYGHEIGDNRLQTIWRELKKASGFEKRRKEIAAWNDAQPHRKRGLAITPVKFGISFTVTHLNQGGAFVLLYQDGSAQVNHGGTEMGQGVHTNIAAIALKELGLKPEQVRILPTSTDKVPNTSATAASCGTDLNGAAVRDACETLRSRLLPIAIQVLKEQTGRTARPANIVFAGGFVRDSKNPRASVPFAAVAKKAYLERVSLSATGYYRTPGIHWDRQAGRGHPFHYFAYGAAVAEVEVDGFTGMHRLLRVDILQDVGDSINEAINRGQIEGGFIQGMGWLTCEELKWDEQGRLLTHSPDTYKIPAIGDTPPVFNVTLLRNAAQKNVIYGSKAVGEPPLMLALSVREAIRDAVAAFGEPGREIALPSPATCEAIFIAVQNARQAVAAPTLDSSKRKSRKVQPA